MLKEESKLPIDEIVCQKCHEKMDSADEFCSKCGAPGLKKQQEKKKKRRKILLVISITLILIIAVISAFFLVTYNDVDEVEHFSYAPSTIPSTLIFEFEIDGGSIEIEYTDEPDADVVHVDYHKKWTGSVIKEPSFKTSSDKVTLIGAKVIGDHESEITVTLRTDVKYSFNGDTSSGSAVLIIDEYNDVIIGSMDFDTKSGSMTIICHNTEITDNIVTSANSGSTTLDLNNCTTTNFDMRSSSGSSTTNIEHCTIKNIDLSPSDGSAVLKMVNTTVVNVDGVAKSGSITLSAENVYIDSDRTWHLKGDEASLTFSFTQTRLLKGDLTVIAETSGTHSDIEVNYKGDDEFVRTIFNADAGDELELNNGAGIDTPSGSIMESTNYGDTLRDLISFELTSEDSDITVVATNS